MHVHATVRSRKGRRPRASESAPSSGAERKERKPLTPCEKPMTSHMRSLPKYSETAWRRKKEKEDEKMRR